MDTSSRSLTLGTLLQRNLQRSRYRLLLIALLLCSGMTFQVLYSSWLRAEKTNSYITAEDYSTKYFDVMIALQPGVREISLSSYPPTPNVPGSTLRPRIIGEYDHGYSALVNGCCGDFELMGLRQSVFFYSFSTEDLLGRRVENEDEIVLPQSLADKGNLLVGQWIEVANVPPVTGRYQRITVSLQIVGIYDDSQLSYRPALTTVDSLRPFISSAAPNRLLYNFDRLTADLGKLVSYLQQVYPQERFIHSSIARELSLALVGQQQGASAWLMLLFIGFVFITVQTVILLDFLRQRNVFAAMKSIGITNAQISFLYISEHLSSIIAGGSATVLILLYLVQRLEWLQRVGNTALALLFAQSLLAGLIVLLSTLLLPLLTVRVASINQLLFTRTIPLWSVRLDHLDRPSGDLLIREKEDNLRLLLLPVREEAPNCMIIKAVGDRVKKGEVIASQEDWFGLLHREWCSFCDGTIESIQNNGLVSIKPLEADTLFYTYHESIVRLEMRHRSLIDKGMAAVEPGERYHHPDLLDDHSKPLSKTSRRLALISWTAFLILVLVGAARLYIVPRLINNWDLAQQVTYPAPESSRQLSAAEVAADARWLVETIEKSHPVFLNRREFNSLPSSDYTAARNVFLSMADSAMSVAEFYRHCCTYTASLGDNHTSMRLPNPTLALPLTTEWTADGMCFATGVEVPLGTRLISIQGVSTEEIGRHIDELYGSESISSQLSTRNYMTVFRDIHEAASVPMGAHVVLELLLPQGETVYRQMMYEEVSAAASSQPAFSFGLLADGEIALITSTMCRYDESWQEALLFLEDALQQGVHKVIIDVRNNPGGDSGVWHKFFELMAMDRGSFGGIRRHSALSPRNSFAAYSSFSPKPGRMGNSKVDLIVLTSERTASSAVWLTGFVRDGNLGRIVGHEPGNALTHFGEVVGFTLPNSHLRGGVSVSYFIRPNPINDARNIPLLDVVVTQGEDALELALTMLRGE